MPGRIILRSASDGTYESKGTPFFSDNFNDNTFDAWDSESDPGSDLSTSTDQTYEGAYSMKCVHNDTQDFTVRHQLASAYSEVWAHFYIWFNDVEDSGAPNLGSFRPLIFWDTPGSTQSGKVWFVLDSASPPKIATIYATYWNSGGGQTDLTGTFVPSASTWYEIKARFANLGAGSDAVQVWAGTPGNLDLIIDQTALSFNSSWDIKYHWLGHYTSNLGTWFSLIYYIDDYQLATSDIW